MKKAFSLLALLPFSALAQQPPGQALPSSDPWAPLLANLKPRELGPTNMGGRIAAISVYDKSPRLFYVATASGGLFKTENGGITFAPVFDKETSVSLGAVAVSQQDPNLVWVGTGEPSSRNSVAWGDGVYKSTDGGKTWTHLGLEKTLQIASIVIDPKDNNIVYVGAVGDVWGASQDRGVYKTTDGGKTWTKLLFVNDLTGPINLIMDPKNNKTLLCAMWQRLRKPYDFTSGGPGSGLWKSTDAGKTWRKIDKGLPPGPFGRIGISHFLKDPKMVLATVEYRAPQTTPPPAGEGTPTTPVGNAQPGQKPGQPPSTTGQQGQGNVGGQGGGRRGGNRPPQPPSKPNQSGTGVAFNSGGTYISRDGGDTWTFLNNLNPRPFYFSLPRFDTEDPKRMYLGGVSLHISDDGGTTFRAARVNIHPDNHALWIDPNDANHLLIGNDGGLYQSRDHAVTWEHLNKMPIGQFYAVAFDYRKPYWVYGGLQDNGSWGIPTQTREGGPAFWSVDNVGGGDGFHVAADPNDWRTVYAESQGGALTRRDLKTGQSRFIQPRIQGERIRFNWSTPFMLSPWNSRTIYVGSNKLFKSVNRGDTWKAISPDLSTNDPAKQKAGANSVTPENTGAETHCTIITMSESPMKQGLIYVGTDDGLVWVTQDDGATWTQLTANIPDLPKNTWCSRVTASKWAEGRVYATFDGHRENDFKPYVYVSEDYGKTWSKLNSGLADYDCVYCITEGDKNSDLLYLGSEMGLRFSFDRGKTWSKFRSGFPTVAVHDIVVHPRENDLILATHGRSIWILNVSGPEQLTAENLGKDVFLTKPKDVLLLGNTPGQGWDGDAVFQSPNTQPGTQIMYFLKKDAPGTVKVTVSDVTGEAVSELSGVTGKAGLNSVYWNGRVRGRLASAGDYRVTLTVGGKDYISSVHVDTADGLNQD